MSEETVNCYNYKACNNKISQTISYVGLEKCKQEQKHTGIFCDDCLLDCKDEELECVQCNQSKNNDKNKEEIKENNEDFAPWIDENFQPPKLKRSKSTTLQSWQSENCSFCGSTMKLCKTNSDQCKQEQIHLISVCWECVLKGKDAFDPCPACFKLKNMKGIRYLIFTPQKMQFIEILPQNTQFNFLSDSFEIMVQGQEEKLMFPSFSDVCQVSKKTYLLTGGIDVKINQQNQMEIQQNDQSVLFEFMDLSSPKEHLVDCQYLQNITPSRYMHKTVMLDDYVYILGGIQKNQNTNKFEWLNDCQKINISQGEQATWEKVAPMKQNRSQFGCFAINNFIYVIGGFSAFQKVANSIERYDPNKNEWQTIGINGEGEEEKLHGNSQYFLLGNNIFIIGGSDGKNCSNKALKFNLKDNKLTFSTELAISFAGSKGIQDKNELYIFGGTQNQCVGYKWNTETNQQKEIRISQYAQMQLCLNGITASPLQSFTCIQFDQ